MIKTIALLCLLSNVGFALQEDYTGNDFIQVISNFFKRRNVQTITAATCWSSEVNERLLKKLSAIDRSLSFCLSKAHITTHATWYRHGFMIDLSCDRSINFMHKISNDRIFNLQNDWVLFGERSTTNRTNDTSAIALDVFEMYLGKSYVLPDSAVFFFQEIGNGGVWEIWSGFRASKLDAIRVREVGNTSKDHMEIDDLIQSRTDFRGVELKATTVILDPDHFFGFDVATTAEAGLDVFTLMHYPMIQILARQLNFKFSLSFANDHGWSYGNGSFFGLTGVLQREESDFGAAGSLMRHDRMTAVDYTVGTISLESNILFRQPKLSSVKNIHIQPFKNEVWLMTSLLFVGFVAVIALLNGFKGNDKKTSLTLMDIIELVLGAICQQGTVNVLNVISIKVVVFVLFLTTLFLFNAYSATIVGLFQSTIVSIKNIKDFADEESMTMSIQISPYAKPYFNETTNTILRKLYDQKIKPYGNKAFTDAPQGIERIRTEFHGFMVEKTTAYQMINRKWREEEKCGLSEVQIFKLPVLAIPVTKKSGHRDVFKQKLIQQQEVGIRKRLIERWTPPRPTCDSLKINKNYVSVSAKEIYPTLKLFIYGIIVSLVVFALELASFRYFDSSRHNKAENR